MLIGKPAIIKRGNSNAINDDKENSLLKRESENISSMNIPNPKISFAGHLL
jgi:hypothetical protein